MNDFISEQVVGLHFFDDLLQCFRDFSQELLAHLGLTVIKSDNKLVRKFIIHVRISLDYMSLVLVA